MTLFSWAVMGFLILVTALYVAAEFAAVSARRSRLRHLAAHGNRAAARLLPIIDHPANLDTYIAVCQIGITLASLILGAFAQATITPAVSGMLVRWGGLDGQAAWSSAAIIVLVILTALAMILGELVPKSVALQYPTATALYTVLPMQWSLRLFRGFIVLLNGSGVILLRLLGARQLGHRHIHSPEEIELLIAESRDGGLLEPEEHRRLHRALQLNLRSARQLMVPRFKMFAIDVETPLEQVLQILTDNPYTRVPVYRGSPDNIIGMLHTKEFVRRYVEEGTIFSIRNLLRHIETVHESMTADRLLRLFRERRCHQAVVVDEFGSVEGVVTLEDVLTELLGDVTDELKPDEPRPERLPDGRIRLPGLMRLDQAESWVGVAWKGPAETVGGHVMGLLGHLPETGERITVDGVELEVEQVEHRAVTSVLVRRLEGEPTHEETPHG